jgi:hypothetical protein
MVRQMLRRVPPPWAFECLNADGERVAVFEIGWKVVKE